MPQIGEGSHKGNLHYDELQLALRRYYEDTKQDVSYLLKNKVIDKFGKVASLSSGDGLVPVSSIKANVTPPTTNSITHIVGGLGDTHNVTVEYHYLTADDDFVFGIQTATLNGTTPVPLTQPAARVSRLQVSSGGIPTGPVQCTIGSGGTVWIQIDAGDVQSQHAWTTISHRDVYVLYESAFQVNASGNGSARFRIEQRINKANGAAVVQPNWTPLSRDVLLSDGARALEFRFLKVIPPNTDIRIVASASGSNAELVCRFDGILAIVVPTPDNADPA